MKQAATTQQRTNCNNATPVHNGHCQDNGHRSQRTKRITTHVAEPRRHERRQCDSSTHTQPAITPQHMQRHHTQTKVSPDRSDAQTECYSCRFNTPPTPVLHQGRDAQQILRKARSHRIPLERSEKTHSNATLTHPCGQKRHTTTLRWST